MCIFKDPSCVFHSPLVFFLTIQWWILVAFQPFFCSLSLSWHFIFLPFFVFFLLLSFSCFYQSLSLKCHFIISSSDTFSARIFLILFYRGPSCLFSCVEFLVSLSSLQRLSLIQNLFSLSVHLPLSSPALSLTSVSLRYEGDLLTLWSRNTDQRPTWLMDGQCRESIMPALVGTHRLYHQCSHFLLYSMIQ